MKKISTYILLFTLPVLSIAGTGDWKTYTNASDIRRFDMADSVIWCATNGGVLKLSTQTKEFNKFTNTEGLSGINTVAIEYDPAGFVWTALSDGLLQVYDIDNRSWGTFSEFQNQLLVTDIVVHKDHIYVGLGDGLAKLRRDDIGRWELQWKANIGPIKRILISNNEIWVAQPTGIRRNALDFPNLQIPNKWDHFDQSNGLPSEDVLTLFRFENRIYAGTAEGFSAFDGHSWSTPQMTDQQVRSFTEWNGQLCLASDQGIFHRNENNQWNIVSSWMNDIEQISVDYENVLWASREKKGLFFMQRSDDMSSLQPCTPDGPSSNIFSDMVIDQDGDLWTASTSGGVSRFDGETWQHFSADNGHLPRNDYRSIEVDDFNRIWGGSWGSGMTLFEKMSNDSIKITHLGDMNGHLSGVVNGPNYIVITDIKKDRFGNMWVLNREAATKQVLAVFDMDNNWQYWSTTDGINSHFVTTLEFDYADRKWIGTQDRGLSVLDDNMTVFDRSDDDLTGYLNSSEGLEDNNVKALATDFDRTIWIGTMGGLNYWFGGSVGVRYAVINEDINSILVDPRNNKWFGTAGGLSVLQSDNNEWQHYSTNDSPLVSDYITCFALNKNTGDMYIGTTNGLSRLETPFTQPSENLQNVQGYPNPFVLKNSGARFYIDNLAMNASIKIFTPDGHLVKTIPEEQVLGARASWDGTNNDGEMVAGGIYVFLVTTEDGQSKAGKVAVINP